MKHLYTALAIVFLLPLFSKAQSNYKPGYVVTLSNDTIKGFIDYKEWENNPAQFNFKGAINSKQITHYDLGNAISFGINGLDQYRRNTVSLSNDRTELSNLSTGIDTTTTQETLFLKVLTTGKNLTLFLYKDNIKDRYYVAEGSNKPIELSYHVYFDPEQTSKVVHSTGYKRQLQRWSLMYQPNKEKLQTTILQSDYELKSLANVVSLINGGDNAEMQVKTSGHSFFVGIGLNDEITKMNDANSPINKSKYSSIFPKIAIGADLYLNKNVKKLIFRTELFVTGSSTNIATEGFVNTKFIQTLKFERIKATINPQLIFNAYNGDNIKFYLGAGLAVRYNTYVNKQNKIVYYDSTNKPVDEVDPAFPDTQALNFGVSATTGVAIGNKFAIYVSYNSTSTLNGNLGYTLSSTSYQAGINYFFGDK